MHLPSAYNISIIFIEFMSPIILITHKLSNILHVIQRLSNFSLFFLILFSPCVFFSTHHCESLSDYSLIICLNGNLVFRFWQKIILWVLNFMFESKFSMLANSPVMKRLCIFKRIQIWMGTHAVLIANI